MKKLLTTAAFQLFLRTGHYPQSVVRNKDAAIFISQGGGSMTKVIHTFERVETKYLISVEKRNALLDAVGTRFRDDDFGPSTVESIYFDSPDYRLIRTSIEKPLYKEKLRLRCYNTPTDDSPVFLELKKKYNQVIYKRRETMTLAEARAYLAGGELPKDTQIMHELDWALHAHGDLVPAALISSERLALVSRDDRELRVTFDRNPRWRGEGIALEKGSAGAPLLDSDTYIMEIKSIGAMPLWLADELDELELFPSSFSKYGTVYEKFLSGGDKKCSIPSSRRFIQIPSLSEPISSAR